MEKLIQMGKKITLSLVLVIALSFGLSRISNAATAIELTAHGVYNAINAILTNSLDAGGIIGLDVNNQLSIQATRTGASVNVYSSTGTFSGTLTDTDGRVNFSGCNVIGDVQPPQ